jgi:hypothetical protein
MSQTNQATLPDANAAYGTLFDNVHAQVFFGKLASYGIQPGTEKEAADLLEIAAQLRGVDNPVKQASEQSRFGNAVQALGSVVSSTPYGQKQAAIAQDNAIKQAAATLAQDPNLYNSVLALKAYEAAALSGNP